jgi:hypothetical protein
MEIPREKGRITYCHLLAAVGAVEGFLQGQREL